MAGDLPKVTQLVPNLHPGPWSPSPASLPQTPGALSAPAWLQSPRGACPRRPLDGSLGLRRAARPRGDSAGAAATRATRWPRGLLHGRRLSRRPSPRVQGPCDQRKRVAGSSPGSPAWAGAGSAGSGSAAGWGALPAPGQPPGQPGSESRTWLGRPSRPSGVKGGRRPPG